MRLGPMAVADGLVWVLLLAGSAYGLLSGRPMWTAAGLGAFAAWNLAVSAIEARGVVRMTEDEGRNREKRQ